MKKKIEVVEMSSISFFLLIIMFAMMSSCSHLGDISKSLKQIARENNELHS